MINRSVTVGLSSDLLAFARKNRRAFAPWTAWAGFVIFIAAREALGPGDRITALSCLFLLIEATCIGLAIWTKRWPAIGLTLLWLVATVTRPI